MWSALIALLLAGLVAPLAILPIPKGLNWHAGERIYVQVISNSPEDGQYYNLFLKKGRLIEQVYTQAPYQKWIRFTVPASFDSTGRAVLYAVGQENSHDSVTVKIWSLYEWHRNFGRYRDHCCFYSQSPSNCHSCRSSCRTSCGSRRSCNSRSRFSRVSRRNYRRSQRSPRRWSHGSCSRGCLAKK